MAAQSLQKYFTQHFDKKLNIFEFKYYVNEIFLDFATFTT